LVHLTPPRLAPRDVALPVPAQAPSRRSSPVGLRDSARSYAAAELSSAARLAQSWAPMVAAQQSAVLSAPAAGWAVGCAGCGDAIDGFAIGALSTAGDGGTRFGSGITGGIALGAGVAPFGTRAGSDVSRSAAARAALAR
jgi:hypothetical protein